MAVIEDAEKEIRPETKLKRTRKSKVVEIQEHPAPVAEMPKETVSTKKPSNPWIDHIKNFAKEKGLTYNKAMLDPDLKKTYVKVVSAKNIQTVP